MMQSHNSPTHFLHNQARHYWISQCVFWFGLSVVPFLGIVLWYNDAQWIHIGHIFLQAGLGLAISIPLGGIYIAIWSLHPIVRMVLVLVLAASFAALWTALRIQTFMWVTGETKTWSEFGGWYFGAFYIFLCWSALYHGLKYYRLLEIEHAERLKAIEDTKEEQIKRLGAESIAREAQLKMLRYQINPHFLFNTLNAIYALIKLGDPQKALGMVGKLGNFLRYSLEYDPSLETSLEDEIHILRSYLDIEKVRFGNRLALEFDISDEAKSAKIPSLLLQPLIENSIKYAIACNEEGGFIKITAHVADQHLLLEVIDNGPGFQDSQPALDPTRKSVGLRNTRERLSTLYGADYAFTISDNVPHGVHISIRIPYEAVKSSLVDNQIDNQHKEIYHLPQRKQQR